MPFPRGAESTGGEDPIPYVSLKTKEEGKRFERFERFEKSHICIRSVVSVHSQAHVPSGRKHEC